LRVADFCLHQFGRRAQCRQFCGSEFYATAPLKLPGKWIFGGSERHKMAFSKNLTWVFKKRRANK